MREYLPLFIERLASERQVSKHTVINYRRDIISFWEWYDAGELAILDNRNIQYYIAYLSRRKQAPATIARKLSSLRQFFDFLVEKGQIKDNPTHGIKSPKKASVLPKAIAVDELNQLLDNTEKILDFTQPLQVRDYVIMELLYSAGIRVAELAALNVNDLDLTMGQATV
ncbi:MAG: site-specific integrase, partial [Ostreibacterium sp.]